MSSLMVEFLPTLLMNLINQVAESLSKIGETNQTWISLIHINHKYSFENQATTYVSLEDSYELVITVNVTCMMVLASIYLSISDRCPVTTIINFLSPN